VERVKKQYFYPLFTQIEKTLKQGIASGEFRGVHAQHFMQSMGAVIVMYFNSVAVMKLMTGVDPMAPNRIAERRAAVLDFISAALFQKSANSNLKLQGARK
jgi:Tetracyclin repressor-like, C-terminal domain